VTQPLATEPEEKIDADTSAKNGETTIKEVVLLIHGIRDFAEWEEMVSSILNEIPNIEIWPLKYGRFDALQFWFPIWTRRTPIKKLFWRIREAIRQLPTAKLSVIAHSFGTYAIGNILKENPDIRLHRLILCGAILPSEFRWDQIRERVETVIINDCGIKDIWPALAQSTTFGYGPSGRFGFGTPGVRDRYHDFGHGGFFQEKFVRDFWLPWFRSGEFVKSKAPPPSGTRWHLLTIIQIKWLTILLCALGISWFALTNVPKGEDTLYNFESIHPTLSWPYDATTFNVYPRSTTLRWRTINGATHYLVEVQWENPSDGLWHTLPNYPVAVEEPSYTFNFVGAQPGRWRVAAVNAKNQETQYSEWWYFKYEK
jgi:pimeloyl-ACP methyl ester carboxylesterase